MTAGAIVLGPVAEQMSAAETAILVATTGHPERRGGLLTQGASWREVHPADLVWIETGGLSTARLVRVAKQARTWGDATTAARYRSEVLRRWTA